MESPLKVIIFQLDNEHYGVSLQQIRSIERVPETTSVPGTPNFIKGVINLRGIITPIIDLKERLNISGAENTDSTRVLIVQVGTSQVGLLVDAATEVLDIDSTKIEPASNIVTGANRGYLQGVAKLPDKLLILLDLENVLSLEEINEIQEVVL
jgi:purine-binding chemotaxis protein CheW